MTVRGSVVVLNNVSSGIKVVPEVVVRPVIPLSATAVHAKVTPLVGLVRSTEAVVSPLVINWLSSENTTWGEGLTIILNVSESPSQLISLKVYTDVTVILPSIGAIVLLFATKLAISPVPVEGSPILGLSLTQEYVITPSSRFSVFASKTEEKSMSRVFSPLHRIWLGTVLIPTVGFTVTTTSNGFPSQPSVPTIGVIVYVSVAGKSVEFESDWLIDVSLVPGNPPVTTPTGSLTGADQLYIVPNGTISVGESSVGNISKVSPSQIVISLSAITGVGWTVIVYSNESPIQPSASGVIVYTNSWSTFVKLLIDCDGMNAVVPLSS